MDYNFLSKLGFKERNNKVLSMNEYLLLEILEYFVEWDIL